MKSSRIIYIYDNNIIEKKSCKYLVLNFNTRTLNKGIIQNTDMFIKKYKQLTEDKLFLFKKNIIIIYSNNISINDIEVIKNCFSIIGYKVISCIKNINLLKVCKKEAYLIGDKYLTFYYINTLNEKKVLNIDYNSLSTKEFVSIIMKRVKTNLIIISNNEMITNVFNKFNNVYFLKDGYNQLIKNAENYMLD